MGEVAPAMAAAGAASAVGGQVLSTSANVRSLNTSADMAERSATYKESEATAIEQTSALQERQSRRVADLTIGKQVAGAAASGLSTKSGSPLFNELDSVRQSEIQALDIRRQGALAAMSARYSASNDRLTAAYDRASVPGTILSGIFRGTTMLASVYRPSTGSVTAPGGGGGGGGYPTNTLDG